MSHEAPTFTGDIIPRLDVDDKGTETNEGNGVQPGSLLRVRSVRSD